MIELILGVSLGLEGIIGVLLWHDYAERKKLLLKLEASFAEWQKLTAGVLDEFESYKNQVVALNDRVKGLQSVAQAHKPVTKW